MGATERPLAPLVSSLVDAAHESHAERKLQHPMTQQYAMFEWQLQEVAAEMQQLARSRRKTEDDLSTFGRSDGGGGGLPSIGWGGSQASNRRQTDTDLSYSGSGVLTGGMRGPRSRQSQSGVSSTSFNPDDGGDPTCNLEVRRDIVPVKDWIRKAWTSVSAYHE